MISLFRLEPPCNDTRWRLSNIARAPGKETQIGEVLSDQGFQPHGTRTHDAEVDFSDGPNAENPLRVGRVFSSGKDNHVWKASNGVYNHSIEWISNGKRGKEEVVSLTTIPMQGYT